MNGFSSSEKKSHCLKVHIRLEANIFMKLQLSVMPKNLFLKLLVLGYRLPEAFGRSTVTNASLTHQLQR